MMSKDKQHEDELWKDVEGDQSIKRGGKVIPYGERRKAPFFKVRSRVSVRIQRLDEKLTRGPASSLCSSRRSLLACRLLSMRSDTGLFLSSRLSESLPSFVASPLSRARLTNSFSSFFASSLLSHAHSDHYTNLSKAWKQGPIYCSRSFSLPSFHFNHSRSTLTPFSPRVQKPPPTSSSETSKSSRNGSRFFLTTFLPFFPTPEELYAR